MEKLKVLCFFLIYNMNNVYVSGQYIQSRDYYWRDYTGIIPRDAVEAGGTNASKIYIGQFLIPNISAVLPGMIYPRTKIAVVAYGGTFETANNLKILCSKNVELLRWINVTETSFPASSDLVFGGVQSNITTYIGRIVYKDNIIIGKAFGNNSLWSQGLYLPVDGGEKLVQNYQILAHRPPQQDYYWRNYDGYVPDDAVEGGVKSGDSSYIGQVLIPGVYGIVPAIIEAGNKSALTLNGSKAYLSTNRVKILCSQHKEKLKWVSANVTDFTNDRFFSQWLSGTISDFPKTENLVIGGYNTYGVIYIGKVNYEGDEVIGHVYPITSKYPGCYIPTKANAQMKFTTFDVLTYDMRCTPYVSC